MVEYSGDKAVLGQLRARRLEAQAKSNGGTGHAPATIEERKEFERRSTDGRSLRNTGRSKQFNFKAKPQWIEEVRELADARHVSIPEMLERIVSEWRAAKLPGAVNDYPAAV